MNKGFTQEELAFTQSQQLPLPADIFLQTLKKPNYAKKILDKSGEMNKELGWRKAHLSTTKTPERRIRTRLPSMMKELRLLESTDKELAF